MEDRRNQGNLEKYGRNPCLRERMQDFSSGWRGVA